MKHNYANNIWVQLTQGAHLGKNSILFFSVLFLIFFSSLSVVGQVPIPPSYVWFDSIPQPTVLPLSGETSDIQIAVTNGPDNFIYSLTFGNGVSKRNPDGSVSDAKFIVGNQLKSPTDIVVNSNGLVFIADYDEDDGSTCLNNGKIRVFDNSGVQIAIISTSYFRPIGLAVDKNDNIYSAEYSLPGTCEANKSRIRKFDAVYFSQIDINETQVDKPFRIAVDSKMNVYVSQALSNTNGEVRVFDNDLNFVKSLPNTNIKSPGSLVVDKEDFLHVVDYNGRVNFSQFINYERLSTTELAALIEEIYEGQENNEFSIKIFDPNLIFLSNKTIKDQIDFPIDLTTNLCDRLFLNNSKIFGEYRNIFGFIFFVPEKIEFELEIYKRTPSFDIEKPEIISCVPNQNATLTNGEFILPDYTGLAVFNAIDNCDKDLKITQNPPKDTSITGTRTVTITATDDAGNVSEACTFQVIIEDEGISPTFTCPDADAVPDLNFDVNCNYDIPSYNNLITNFSNFEIAPFFIQSENRNGNSLSVNIKIYDGEGGSFVGECNLVVDLIDVTSPQFTSCNLQDINVELENGETYAVPDFVSQLTATDNCDSNPVTTQSIAAGTPITETTLITLIAKDESGNISNKCEVSIIITEKQNPTFTCPDTDAAPDLNLDVNCNYDSPSYNNLITNFNNFENSPFFVQSENRSGNSLSVNIKIYDGEGGSFVGECNLVVDLIDVTAPQFTSCNIQDINVELENGETYAVPDFVSQLTATDNCDSNPVITQSIASGTSITETTLITLIAKDESGNVSNTCEVSINVAEKPDPTFDCLDPNQTTVLELDENCTYSVPDYSGRVTNFQNFMNEPFFVQTQVRNEDVLAVTIKVFDGVNGEEAGSCQFLVNLEDQIPPVVTCPNDILIPYTDSKEYEIEDYYSQLIITDNCSDSFTYTQTPQPGNIVSENTIIEFTITDENNNMSGCNFEVKFYKESELQILNCPGDQIFEVDSNCSYLIPDIASSITTNIEGAVVTQNITPGFRVNNSLTLTITAKFEGQTDTCTVDLMAKDSIDPVVVCPGDVSETYNPDDGFALPNYSLQAQTSDNCAVAKIEQIPDVGTLIFEDTVVTVRIEDISGNSSICTFNVILTEENTANTPPISTNNSYSTMQNNTLTVTSSSGVLSNDSDPEGESLTAVLISDVTSGTLTLNPDGSFEYVPDTGFFGNDFFTYSANDGNQNSVPSTASIEVIQVSDNSVICKESVTLELDGNGNATLIAKELFTARPADLQFSVDQEVFTCEDLGENIVTLSYSNNEIQDTCEIKIIVKDVSPPILRVKDISVALNEFRSVTITPEMLDDGSSDKCENLSFSLSQLTFGCKELGENTVIFTATDASGNFTSTTATVTVTGDCTIKPEPEVEFIFIYPNPTSGPFQFATPTGVTIQRVEVFDFRGRMILFKDFSETDLQYRMDLTGVQNAVYVLKLFTSEGMEIKRVIID
ncbi:Ig-like domain-containing protein [Gillisia hiemivivida]|uniref:HYR domain-containing protein n=1 Tax=Gillisia hiemivivida TaxID=291190 RepID=A0A5C7A0M7_9FLAO|nr:Ig-like domain-containing protein [Gillisia hiemivivida]TXD94562.1 HYR domain-containing protein [Gillisia hiemivivida]